ncbi:hypothetical protein [Tabrizicola sp.]|uniref:hypothetical protein n=1 Tax=Tabrizicola sp. TaxID=2005166 RepID=UPI0027370D7B|nr:hypothetical protein [Tabrizicola sp.]MDP3195231.1 hypothetical protein [Tabrizicola sp.]MDZ4070055.1 hypothetical protein [Tabrizicola sp.]
MRSAAPQTPDTTQRHKIVRRASANIGVIVVGLVLASFCGVFLAIGLWAVGRTGQVVTGILFSLPGGIALTGIVGALAMTVVGVRRLRRGDTVALVLAPEGVALPEQSVPPVPWPQVTGIDRTYGRGACLRLFLDRQDARLVRPHAILRLNARRGNLRPRDMLCIFPQGLLLELEDLQALIRAYQSAHGGPRAV